MIDTGEESREISRRLQAIDDGVALATFRSERRDQRGELKRVIAGRQGCFVKDGFELAVCWLDRLGGI